MQSNVADCIGDEQEPRDVLDCCLLVVSVTQHTVCPVGSLLSTLGNTQAYFSMSALLVAQPTSLLCTSRACWQLCYRGLRSTTAGNQSSNALQVLKDIGPAAKCAVARSSEDNQPQDYDTAVQVLDDQFAE